MKMWIIPVAVWVGLATTTLFAPKPDNNLGFPFDPQGMAKKCSAATWVTSAVTPPMCALLKVHGDQVKKAYEGMSPLDLQDITNDSKKITTSPAWNQLLQARKACPQPKNGLGNPGCNITPKEFNTTVQNSINVHNQVTQTMEDCIAKQNRVEQPEAISRVLPFCAARTIKLTQQLANQFKEDSKE